MEGTKKLILEYNGKESRVFWGRYQDVVIVYNKENGNIVGVISASPSLQEYYYPSDKEKIEVRYIGYGRYLIKLKDPKLEFVKNRAPYRILFDHTYKIIYLKYKDKIIASKIQNIRFVNRNMIHLTENFEKRDILFLFDGRNNKTNGTLVENLEELIQKNPYIYNYDFIRILKNSTDSIMYKKLGEVITDLDNKELRAIKIFFNKSYIFCLPIKDVKYNIRYKWYDITITSSGEIYINGYWFTSCENFEKAIELLTENLPLPVIKYKNEINWLSKQI